MGAPRYIYQRRGGPLLSWAGGPPSQSRAADTKALGGWFDGLGSLGDFDHPPGNVFGLPMPGAPEFLAGYDAIPSSSPPIKQHGVGDVSCKCGGSCGCSGGLGDDGDMSTGQRVLYGALAYLVATRTSHWKHGGAKSNMKRYAALGVAAYLGYKAVKG